MIYFSILYSNKKMTDNQATTAQDIKEIFSAKIVSFDLQN
jgi:hypothetical protein